MRNSLPAALAPLFVLAACAAPQPEPTPAFPSRASIATGRPMAMHRNDPMGLFGTMALMADAPRCGFLRAGDTGQPLRLRDLAGQAVTPAFALAPAACPTANAGGVPYLALDRAVLLDDGLYAEGGSHECFLPNTGGGHCRPVGR